MGGVEFAGRGGRSPWRWVAVAALTLAGMSAQAEFVRDTGAGVSVNAHEWGLVCGGCPFAFETLADMSSFAPGTDNGHGEVGDHWVASAYASMTGQFSGEIANVQANGASGRRRGSGTVDGFTNPNTTWHAEAGGFADVSMLLINDQPTAMRYTVAVDMFGALIVSTNLGQAVPASVIGGATAFTFEADPYGEGGDVIGFWSHSATAGSTVSGPDASGSFSFVVPQGGKFWLWGYAGANAVSIDTSLDPSAGVAGIDTQALANVVLSLTAVPVPVPEPPAALLGLAGLTIVLRLGRIRRIGDRSRV